MKQQTWEKTKVDIAKEYILGGKMCRHDLEELLDEYTQQLLDQRDQEIIEMVGNLRPIMIDPIEARGYVQCKEDLQNKLRKES